MLGNDSEYVYIEFEAFTEELREEITKNKKKFSPQTISLLIEILKRIEEAHKLMKVVDYLFSSELSEEDFLQIKDKLK